MLAGAAAAAAAPVLAHHPLADEGLRLVLHAETHSLQRISHPPLLHSLSSLLLRDASCCLLLFAVSLAVLLFHLSLEQFGGLFAHGALLAAFSLPSQPQQSIPAQLHPCLKSVGQVTPMAKDIIF